MPRIGAEYQDPRERNQATPVQHARLAFLGRIERVAPEVLATLRSDVLPRFARWRGEGAEPWYFVAALSRWPTLRALPQSEPLTAFTNALDGWAARWGLTDEWLRDDALSTLRTWHEFPQTLTCQPLRFHSTDWGGAVLELDVPPCAPFAPTMETRVAFETRVKDWTRRNIASAKQLAKDHGLEAGPEKRARRGGDPGVHFEWLARRQCGEERYVDIAGGGDDAPDESVVRKAVSDTARLIGLSLRK